MAVASTLAWAMVQRSLLTDYFGPIINDVVSQFGGGERRKPSATRLETKPHFWTKSLSSTTPPPSGTAGWLGLKALGFWRRGERHVIGFSTHFMLLMFSGCLPVFLAARVVPKGGELFDRGSSFLFIPFGLMVGVPDPVVLAGRPARAALAPTAATAEAVHAETRSSAGCSSGPQPSRSWAATCWAADPTGPDLPGLYMAAADPGRWTPRCWRP